MKELKKAAAVCASVLALCLASLTAFAHPGGLNSEGCHTNRKTGEYHCHGAGKKSAPPNTPNDSAEQPPMQSFMDRGQAEQQPLSIVGPSLKQYSKGPQAVRVVGVVDGDTIKVLLDGKATNIRLHGIDAPETGQAYGQAATKIMREITTGRPISINILEQDRYGRPVALVYADGVSAQEVMLELGYAWVYTKYCSQSYCSQWEQLQEKARQQRKGLWKDKAVQPPWEWRHGGAVSRSDDSSAMQGIMVRAVDNSPVSAKQEAAAGGRYSGNTSSNKFHSPGCRHYNCRDCTAVFSSREQAIEAGYSPCGMCKP